VPFAAQKHFHKMHQDRALTAAPLKRIKLLQTCLPSSCLGANAMKNIYDVLQQKEADIDRLRQELQALRIVAPLLEGELEVDPEVASGPGLGPDLSHAISPAG